MLLLTTTNDILQVTTSSSQSLDYTVSYVDITTTTFTPGSGQGNIASATTTTILAAPGASTQRQVKQITLTNAGASANAVTVVKDISATEYKVFPTVTLAAGESLVYQDGGGWTYFAADGTEQTPRLAAGSDTEIQFNDGGVLTGSSNLTYDSATNTLALAGTSPLVDITGISAEPSSPAASTLRIYSKKVSGRMLPKWRSPSGLDTCFQPAMFGNHVTLWSPQTTSGTWFGSIFTAIAAGVATLPTTTNRYTSLRRAVFTVATGANLQNSIRSENMFYRGNAAGQGGFFSFVRFGFTTWTSNNRLFVGFTAGTTAVTTGNPSALTNIAGFGIDQGDTAITFMHNDGAGTAAKETISGQPSLASSNAYDAFIFCAPNSSEIFYRLDDITAGTTIIDSSVTTELPVDTTMLNIHAAIGSGSNAGAGVAALGVNKIYVETDY